MVFLLFCWRFVFLWFVGDTHSNLDGFFFYIILLCTNIMDHGSGLGSGGLARRSTGFLNFTDIYMYMYICPM